MNTIFDAVLLNLFSYLKNSNVVATTFYWFSYSNDENLLHCADLCYESNVI